MHVPFPNIESFFNIVKYAQSIQQPPITYQAKIKLHGTNAGITVIHNQVFPQSRNSLLTPQDDNAGFAKWVDTNYFGKLPDCTIFGEWCGPGIMKGTAINKIPHKIFAVFAVKINTTYLLDPSQIVDFLPKSPPHDLYILPWHGDPFVVDFTKKSTLKKIAADLSNIVADLENRDPWVQQTFNVEGTAEGLVFYPHHAVFDLFVFKAKGEKHKVVHTKQIVQIDPEIAQSIDEFVDLFVTVPRLEQGLNEIPLDIKNTGRFVQWLSLDVKKESSLELLNSNLSWKQVENAIITKARTWFINKTKEI